MFRGESRKNLRALFFRSKVFSLAEVINPREDFHSVFCRDGFTAEQWNERR